MEIEQLDTADEMVPSRIGVHQNERHYGTQTKNYHKFKRLTTSKRVVREDQTRWSPNRHSRHDLDRQRRKLLSL